MRADPTAELKVPAARSAVAQSLSRPNSEDPVVRIPVWIGVVLRIILFFFTNASSFLQLRVEVSTPVTSWKRLREGLYLYQNGIAPYEGGVFHQAPLLLAIFNFLPPILIPILFIALDYAIARGLVEIAQYKRKLQIAEIWPAPTSHDSLIDTDVGAMYLLNPYSIITCLSQSTLLFTLIAIVGGIQYAIKGNRNASMLFIAVAAYLSFYPAMMMAPAILLLSTQTSRPVMQALKSALPLFLAFLAALLGLSYLLVGTWDFLPSTYGVILSVPDLTPNIGLFWYFFIEMFEQFRPFFLCVFQIMVFIFVIPIALVFRYHPLFVAYATTAIMAIFKSYPSVGDTALYLAFFTMHQELYKYMRNTFLVFNALFFASILGPLFHYLWVYAGSGNANFYFAITLVFGLAQIILLTDTGHALILREWERLHPDLRRKRVELVHQ
ncbi:GPI transamidase subunit PIG-U [Powellomyces hirtus]|nr:GPI transamidase subunit PIG-U [Powellomyces hirtus]